MQKSHDTRYSPSLTNALLADSFAGFFTTKVENILIKGSVKTLPLWQET